VLRSARYLRSVVASCVARRPAGQSMARQPVSELSDRGPAIVAQELDR
jgi:hypothetical protein